MTDRDLEQRLRAWYADGVPDSESAPVELRDRLATIPVVTPTPLRTLRDRRGLTLLAAAAILVAGGTFVAAGSGLLRLTPVQPPAPSNALVLEAQPSTPDETPAPTAAPTAVARSGELIAYTHTVDRQASCFESETSCPVMRVWIVGLDGSGARELIPEGVTWQQLMAWTPDGSRVLFADEGGLYLADPAGGQPQPVDTGCPPPAPDTPNVCWRDSQAVFSRDGRHLVFNRESLDADGYAGQEVIATMDLETGRVTELTSTSGGGVRPGWSPDGSRIVFSRYGTKDDSGPLPPVAAAVFVVDADGSDLRQVSPPTLDAIDAQWSPDGGRIVFVSAAEDRPGAFGDIYTIGPDGSDLRRLTSDGLGASPSWTPDGRILFARRSGGAADASEPGWWTMDADGGDLTLVQSRSTLGLSADELGTSIPVAQPLGGPALPTLAAAAPPVAVGPAAPTPAPTPAPELAAGFSWTGTSTFDSTGPLGGTTTLLADGRVLLTEACATAAELYDPSTGAFTPTGDMTSVRGGDTATLLNDGRVLFTGGYNCGRAGEDGLWASAELYDPATGTFSPTGSMRSPREFHTATLLPDGRVLIAGGISGPEPAAAGAVVLASYRTVDTTEILASAELYDPVTGTFSRTGAMSTGHMRHTATSLRDGRVLIAGGGGGESSSGTEAAEIFDPSSGTFHRTGSLSTVRESHTATLLADGRVLVAGGSTPNDTVSRSAELYDPRSGTFSDAESMADRRQEHTATLLPDGRVLIAGGFSRNANRWRILSETELFDPATGAFTSSGSMGTPRSGHAAPLLLDGRVLIVGGSDALGGVATAVLYQP